MYGRVPGMPVGKWEFSSAGYISSLRGTREIVPALASWVAKPAHEIREEEGTEISAKAEDEDE